MCCYYLQQSDQFKSQIHKYHNSLVVTFANLWPGWQIRITLKTQRICTRFWLWARQLWHWFPTLFGVGSVCNRVLAHTRYRITGLYRKCKTNITDSVLVLILHTTCRDDLVQDRNTHSQLEWRYYSHALIIYIRLFLLRMFWIHASHTELNPVKTACMTKSTDCSLSLQLQGFIHIWYLSYNTSPSCVW